MDYKPAVVAGAITLEAWAEELVESDRENIQTKWKPTGVFLPGDDKESAAILSKGTLTEADEAELERLRDARQRS